ncbi:transglycosylase domain-containing protein [Actinoplanes sp. NBRC 103695]|uniref:transglycosylase domain-containing protein n=1 Tax=Actinoplanes sp. NBRC 103695 TaxID=3032202 RepID=UPI0024A09636|nr:transglycosylase domain-containing protein [Actinoplanes sp. NBRC 103695]GLY94022.1 penicillin-binding protein 1A [Actinoplanes sp. NBRC 103695]
MAAAIAVLIAGAGVTVAVYVNSVDLPADPVKVQASTLYYRDGRTILARVGTQNHSDVPLSAVPEHVRQAVLAAEDRDFYDHPGFSVRGILRAVMANISGKREGASTITQQYARNAYLTQDVSLDRKAKEFALAVKLERKLGKDQILERYLNTIYYGRNAYGIAAAAYAYFGVTTDRLTAAQGAVLAATIKDPFGYDPANNALAAQQRWTWIIGAAREKGWLGGALAYPDVSRPSAADAGPSGIVIDRVEQELAARGVTSRALHTQGLSVVTTLDAQAQQAGLAQVAKHLAGQPKDLRVALVAVDPHSGGVLAYYGGKQRGNFDDASAAHPAASTFKPIVLAAALEVGISAQSLWDGSSPRLFPGRLGVPLYNHDDQQCPACTLTESMVDSLNTPFYAVTEKLGADRVREKAFDLGISPEYGNTRALVDAKGDPKPGRTRPDIAIGRYAVTPADLATVYATFAGAGVRHDRHFVDSVTGADQRRLWKAEARPRRVLDRAAAADITSVLAAVVDKHAMTPDRPAAGKTGTQQWGNTKDSQDAWMAGYTPELASVVWIGKANPGPIRDKRGKAIDGDTMPAQLWTAFTREALRGRPVTPLPEPGNVGKAGAFDVRPSAPESEPGGKPVPRDLSTPDPRDLAKDARQKAAAAQRKEAPEPDTSQEPTTRRSG